MENSKEATKQQNQEDEQYISVQDYDGEGYTLRGGRDEAVDIAKQHKKEIVKAVEEFFLNNYKTEVKVNHFIGAKDAVSVTVESVNEPFFYSFAIVPVNFKSKTVATDQVFTLEGEVEKGIKGGLYVMAYEEEFSNLDNYLQTLDKEYPIIGMNKEAIQNTNSIHGYATPYYFVTPVGETFNLLFEKYMDNPSLDKQDLQQFLKDNPIDSKYITITLNLFMEDSDIEPDQEIFEMIVNDIKRKTNIPHGSYSLFIYENEINRHSALGKNGISGNYPEKIIKN
ncbi:DUF1672 family protein [Cerasibacillus terrae]|uniref:DUF1672 family protein n=1 Tax=Cerasibacillus terrae TaxID=2498845 RepID=A0A5C8P0H7_9BACI|nr:DUF1672 family protein [Cerasibacillus terrae]TXL66735.1 DUF1672 family protein [Cerasibacillus terrae]